MLHDPQVVDWLADEILHMHEQATGRTAEGAREARRGSSIQWVPSGGGTGWHGRGPSGRTYLLRRVGRGWNLHIEGRQYGPFDSLEAAKAEAEQHEQATGRTAESGTHGIADQLDSIKILFVAPDTLALWGVPYGMRRGQQPGDLWRARNTKGWIWLGSPGWWGNMPREDQAAVEAFLAKHSDSIPGGPYEWIALRNGNVQEAPRSKAPAKRFKSPDGRTFTLGKMQRTPPRFEGDHLWTETWPILYKGDPAGKLFRSEKYRAPLEWHASTRELYWKYARDAPTGIGFDVAAFATPQEALTAWGRSADQILDWSEGKPVHTIYKGSPHQKKSGQRRRSSRKR